TFADIPPSDPPPLLLPRSPGKPRRPRVKRPTHRQPEAQAPLVLIVDDMHDNREMYAQFLRFAGFRVEAAGDGFEALDKARSVRPNVIIMDLALPGMDGWETTRRIKDDERTR